MHVIKKPHINILLTPLLIFLNTRKFAMAWRSSGSSNQELVNNLKRNAIFTNPRVEQAMMAVDRADFSVYSPYEDSPQTIGYSATISAPHMHAAALEYLKNHLVAGARALDVGSGSGYLTVCMSIMVGPNGTVAGIEHIQELVEMSIKNTGKHHQDLLDLKNITFVVGDGRLGYPPKSPYNAIHVGAAAKGVPKALIDQLAIGGRMMIPIERSAGNQEFVQIDKLPNGEVVEKVVEHVIYVPLTNHPSQR